MSESTKTKLLEALRITPASGGCALIVAGELKAQSDGSSVGIYKTDDGVTYAWVDLIIRGDTPRVSIEAGSAAHKQISGMLPGAELVMVCSADYQSKTKTFKGHRNGTILEQS